MNSIFYFLSWWIPKRRYSLWHCNILELLIAVLLYFVLLPLLTLSILNLAPGTPEKHAPLTLNNALFKTTSDPIGSEKQDESADSQTSSTTTFNKGTPNDSHPVIRLIQTKNWTFICMGFYLACILAPINEELIFRGGIQNCLQGFLTTLFKKQLHIHVKTCKWLISFISIILPAVFFALVHYRSPEMSSEPIEKIIQSITVACIAWTLFPIICFSYLFFVRHIRPRDMFGTWREAPKLAFYGVKWIWILIPSYILSLIFVFIRLLTKTHFIPDPFCLIPLSLVFGFLYYRTQSILPSIVLHILFNFTSLSLVLLLLI